VNPLVVVEADDIVTASALARLFAFAHSTRLTNAALVGNIRKTRGSALPFLECELV
jgi:hypothetical protein